MNDTMAQNPTSNRSEAEHIAAIEEMEQRLKIGFDRIEETQARTREIQLRVDRLLDRLEASR